MTMTEPPLISAVIEVPIPYHTVSVLACSLDKRGLAERHRELEEWVRGLKKEAKAKGWELK